MAITEREQRGLAIAALCRLQKNKDGVWMVPSQTGEGKYVVRHDENGHTCTCPDYELRKGTCKHIYAVQYTIEREKNQDGTVTLTETVTVQKKTTYKQEWPAYNRAQGVEKNRVQRLLVDLCRHLPEPERDPEAKGNKPHTVKDSIFAMCLKVYCGLSARRTQCDLDAAHTAGHLSRRIPAMKVVAFMENADFTPILTNLIARAAAPLAAIETKFAVDSTGFSTCRFEKWFDVKYGVTRTSALWVKVHAAVGVKTNVITAVRILDKDAADSPQFRPLVEITKDNFTIDEVSGDKAYASVDNYQAVVDAGGVGYMAFKSNTTGAAGGIFEKMFHYFQFQRDEFLKHYHLRSNIESTFGAVKKLFGDSVRSKTDTAMVNETLCKLLCFNLTCLIHEQEKLGIAPVFWKDDGAPAVCKAEPLPIRNAVEVTPAPERATKEPAIVIPTGTFVAGWGV
jgi:transposase/predicted nucleic acid-binding Zn finger protein